MTLGWLPKTSVILVSGSKHHAHSSHQQQLTVSIWGTLETLFANLEHLRVDVNQLDGCRRIVVNIFAIVQEPHSNVT